MSKPCWLCGVTPPMHSMGCENRFGGVKEPSERDGREYKAILANLTSTQARCTELLEEVRALRRALRAIEADDCMQGHCACCNVVCESVEKALASK